MTLFTTGEGNTPLSPDEQADLIPNLATKEELNQWERENIIVAYSWALNPRNLGVPKHVLIEEIFSNMKNKQLLEGALASIKTVRKNLGGVTMIPMVCSTTSTASQRRRARVHLSSQLD
jgi:hypothetical protein